MISIVYDKIHLKNSPWPEINASSAHVDNFVSLEKRENIMKRFMGTLGRHIKKNESDSNQEKTPIYVTF